MTRYLLLLTLALLFSLWVLKKYSDAIKFKELLIEDIVNSLKEEYQKSHKNSEAWLERLRQIRQRYGDKISKRVADQLRKNIEEE